MHTQRSLLILLLFIIAIAGCRASVTVRTGHDGAPPPRHHRHHGTATTAPSPDQQSTTSTPTPAPAPESGGSTSTPAQPPSPTTQPTQGSPCTTRADCPERMSCRGEAGCDATWTCQPEGQCTADLVPFCGCDGQVFRASSTCPGRPYRNRGGCSSASTAPPRPGHATATAPARPASRPAASSPPPPGRPSGTAPARPAPQPAGSGQGCTSSSDCPNGQMCIGNQGCSAGATCVARRPCTLDLVPYCGCDGQIFRGSSSCPPRPYVQRGPCQSDGPVPDVENR